DEGIDDLPHRPFGLLALHFEVRDCGAEHRIPVDEALAAVDEAFLVKPDKDLDHRPRHLRVHGEVLLLPVSRGAEAPHLPRNRRARLFLPLPDALDELLAAEVMPRLALLLELALDHDLRGDASMVGADHPVHVVAAHAVVAD